MGWMGHGVIWSQVMSDEKPVYKSHMWDNRYRDDGQLSHKECVACRKEWHFFIDPPVVGPCKPL